MHCVQQVSRRAYAHHRVDWRAAEAAEGCENEAARLPSVIPAAQLRQLVSTALVLFYNDAAVLEFRTGRGKEPAASIDPHPMTDDA